MTVKELQKVLNAFSGETDVLVATNYFSELMNRDFNADTIYFETSENDDLSLLSKNSCSIKRFLHNSKDKVLFVELDIDSLPPAGY